MTRPGAEADLLETLYRDHERVVQVFVRRRVRNRAIADDIVSETFLAAADVLAREPERHLTVGWVLTVARRRVADHWRRAERREQLNHRLLGGFIPALDPIDRIEDRRCIQQALASLPSRQHDAITLRYLLGTPVVGVADHVGCSYECAESLLARGRRGFARAYAAEGV
ncbi:MAG: RNA polymerase sigma factor [Acidimicrobiales bacterium]